jgi:hypothetical protein
VSLPPTVTLNARLLDMAEFKQVARTLASNRPATILGLEFYGKANQIGGYRLYYMLQYAKREAGIAHVSLITDGLFWIEEASDWLMESGVDEIAIVPSEFPDTCLADRIREFQQRSGAPPVRGVNTGRG